MARYIDADALIEAIKHELWDWKTLDGITSTTVLKQTITDIQNTPTADVVEIKKEGEWEMFDLISSAYYGKQMYFKEDNGIVYSRYSHNYMSVDKAIREFISLIDGTEEENG